MSGGGGIVDVNGIRRRLLAMQKTGLLPAGYVELKYIEANGNHFINTDAYQSDMNDIIRATFACTLGGSNEDSAIFAGRTGMWALGIGSLTRQSPYVQKPLTIYIGASDGSGTRPLMDINTFYEVEANAINTTYTFDGVVYEYEGRWDRYSPTLKQYQLFNYNSKTSVTTRLKLKYAEVVGKGIFIPCMRKSDNKVGVYNIITGTFLTNDGTGEFGYETLNGTYVAPVT